MDVTAAAGAAEEADDVSPLDPSHAPLLLFDHTARGQQASDAKSFFYSIPKKQVVITRVDGIMDHRYWTTPQGWLVMAACGSPDMFLCDPFTGTRISLPPNRDGFLTGNGHWRCLLSREPVAAAHPNCTDVDVLALSPEGTVFWHCRLGRDKRWLRYEYNERPLAPLSTLNGRFIMHFVNKVVMVELSTEPVAFSEIPVSIEPASLLPLPYTCFVSQMVESRGDLFCVRFFLSDLQRRTIAAIGVSKLDFSARVWVREELLDGRVFIVLPGQYGVSLDPREGLEGDCIYYCRPRDKAVYVYDMSRGTTTLRNPGSCLLDNHSPIVLMPTCC
ncbi:hypothetical protein HU200_065065 [Digitaria exilis]|uniref:KIB1-4 beta-propeller domain-containing protein n=1 Tax=Digitaria exilis TaxID=1010633 RepID=A0A834ZYR7_9POAL|nr:hypothetical protein HU200_065065 [Digitaria exilis]